MSKLIDKWNDAAGQYATSQERSSFAGSNKAVVRERFARLNGERILDLGCGYGYYTDYFRSAGGDVVGIDGAEAMITIAREKYPEGDFRVADITEPLKFDDGTFDIVFCNQVLMDIAEIEGIIGECRRVLKAGGILYISIIHPAFYNGEWTDGGKAYRHAKEITSYLTESRSVNRFWGETDHYHRPISYYLNLLADNGFCIRHVEEPRTYDGITQNDDLPLFMMIEGVKV